MGVLSIFERGGEEYHEYKRALKLAKKSIEKLCELSEDMEDEYGYSERDEMSERRMSRRMR